MKIYGKPKFVIIVLEEFFGKMQKAMLERKISHYIEHFYEVNKGALLLAGARQIGKTYSIM